MNRKGWLVIGIIILLFFLGGFYLGITGSFDKKAGSVPGPGDKPAEQNTNDKKSESVGRNGLSEQNKMEFPSNPILLTKNKPLDLEEHTMSLKKKNRDIAITPDVLIRPSEGVIIKGSDSGETIRIRRDNTYRSGEYKVFLERKY